MTRRKKQIEELLSNIRYFKQKIFIGTPPNIKNDGITASQWFVLRYLAKNEGAALKEAAKSLGITSSAATQLVVSLVRKGYVIRETGKKDRRELRLMLSEKSKKHIAELRNNRIKKLEHIFNVLNDEEFESYCRLFNKIAQSLAADEK